MFHSKTKLGIASMINTNTSSIHHHHDDMTSGRPMPCLQGDSTLVLTTDPKPRLRWTVELHERFVDAVTQLGGPDKATPKTIMRVMGVKGLTLYHLKSHLQKFRLGKQPHKENISGDHPMEDASAIKLYGNSASSSGMITSSMNEMQMEVQRRMHEQLEVQRHLQLRIEAQGQYMQTILEKACQTLAGEKMATNNPGYKGVNRNHHVKDYGPNLNFLVPQDLNQLYGSDPAQPLEVLHHHQLSMERTDSSLDGFLSSTFGDSNLCLGKKRPNIDCSSKSPIIWPHDLRLDQELGNAALCLGSQYNDEYLYNGARDSAEEQKRVLSDQDAMGDKKPNLSAQLGMSLTRIPALNS